MPTLPILPLLHAIHRSCPSLWPSLPASTGIQCFPLTVPVPSLPAAIYDLVWLSPYFHKCHFICSFKTLHVAEKAAIILPIRVKRWLRLSDLSKRSAGVGWASSLAPEPVLCSGWWEFPPCYWFHSPLLLLTLPLFLTKSYLSKNFGNGCVVFEVSEKVTYPALQ